MATSLDPYSTLNKPTNGSAQSSQQTEPEERIRTDSTYIKMIPSEHSQNMTEHLQTFKPSGRSATIPDPPPSSNQDPSSTGNMSQTLPLGLPVASFPDGFQDEDQEEYVDPSELRNNPTEDNEYYNQEVINQLRLSAPGQEEYVAPSELGYGYSSQTRPEEDHSTLQHPPVPPRGVVCASSDNLYEDEVQDEPRERHDTMDNEYVEMKPQIDKLLHEHEVAGHSYVNVTDCDRRPGRSVTLPSIGSPPIPAVEEQDQPTYYNVHHNTHLSEEMYTRIP